MSSFYNELSMHRRHVQTIVDSTRMFVNKIILSYLKPNVVNFAKDIDDAQYKIEQIFNLFENPFESLDSEFKRFQYFKEQGTFVEPESYIIGQQTIGKKLNSNYVIVPTNVTGQYVSVKLVIQKLFALPNFLKEILNYMQNLSIESNVISNIIQATSYKKLQEKYPRRIIVPLIFYYDEFEVNDPLGLYHIVAFIKWVLCIILYRVYLHMLNLNLLIYSLHYCLIVLTEKNLETEVLFYH